MYHGRFKNRECKKCSAIDCLCSKLFWQDKTAVGLAQSVERLTVELEIMGLISGVGPLLSVLKYLRNEGSPFAMQAVRPWSIVILQWLCLNIISLCRTLMYKTPLWQRSWYNE